MPAQETASPESRALLRIEWLAVALGLVAAAMVAALRGPRAGCGVIVGTGLSWINFRWLKAGVNALVGTGRGAIRFALRLALLAAALCGIFVSHLVPLGAVLGGLFVVPAATLAEALGQLFAGRN